MRLSELGNGRYYWVCRSSGAIAEVAKYEDGFFCFANDESVYSPRSFTIISEVYMAIPDYGTPEMEALSGTPVIDEQAEWMSSNLICEGIEPRHIPPTMDVFTDLAKPTTPKPESRP